MLSADFIRYIQDLTIFAVKFQAPVHGLLGRESVAMSKGADYWRMVVTGDVVFIALNGINNALYI